MTKLNHKFVKYVPKILDEKVIYISMEFKTCSHLCCCGCGAKVVTPLSPTDWEITYNGNSVSLYPSIGNWSDECQSHYWIKNNIVEWSYKMSDMEIEIGRASDRKRKSQYYKNLGNSGNVETYSPKQKQSIFSFILNRLFRK